jgi:hypothetical protein
MTSHSRKRSKKRRVVRRVSRVPAPAPVRVPEVKPPLTAAQQVSRIRERVDGGNDHADAFAYALQATQEVVPPIRPNMAGVMKRRVRVCVTVLWIVVLVQLFIALNSFTP